MANVSFKFGTQAQYNALLTKDNNTLYWLYDVLELRKGEDLYGTGKEATDQVAGLMSPADKAKLDKLIEGGVKTMTALDASIVINDVDGGKAIGVAISAAEGNALMLSNDGLFVPVASAPLIPEFSIERQADSADDIAVSYKLKRTCGDEVTYVGDVIDIPKDMVVKSGTLENVVMADQPYSGAVVGDPYIDLVLSDIEETHIYIPVKGLVDVYTDGMGIKIVDGTIALKLSAVDANGLVVTEDGLALNLATRESAGAMSPVDKLVLDGISSTYEKIKYEILQTPTGAVVDYREKEIRVMCPADTEWSKQAVGANGNPNMHYIALRAYAPDNAVSFKEDDQAIIEDNTMYTFDDEFAGVDEFGRKYSVVYLPAAAFNEDTNSWTYYGSMSGEKFIGWYYTVEWYDADGVMIANDQIRVNLSNENCHTRIEPYYMDGYVTSDELQAALADIEETFTWGEM